MLLGETQKNASYFPKQNNGYNANDLDRRHSLLLLPPPLRRALSRDLRPLLRPQRSGPRDSAFAPERYRRRVFLRGGFSSRRFPDGFEENLVGKLNRIARAGLRHGPIIPTGAEGSTERFFKLTHYRRFRPEAEADNLPLRGSRRLPG